MDLTLRSNLTTIANLARPLGKRLLLIKEDAPEMSEGGIVIPDEAREKPLVAYVVAGGEDAIHLDRGSRVVFASFAGTEFTIDGHEVIVVDEDDIMLVLPSLGETK